MILFFVGAAFGAAFGAVFCGLGFALWIFDKRDQEREGRR